MICHQSHQLQTRDLNPKELNRDLRYLNLGESVVCRQVDQHLPLDGLQCDMHQLIFERVQSY